MIKDVEGEFEYEVGPNYVLSPKDVCTLPFIEKLVFSEIESFKIEGRNKSPEYVSDVTSVYREIVDIIWDNKDRQFDKTFQKNLAETKDRLTKKLERVFNRGSSDGFYMGKPLNEWTKSYGSEATERKIFLGKLTNYYSKIGVAEFKITAKESVKIGDEVFIQGPNTGIIRMPITSMEIEHEPIEQATQDDTVAIKTSVPVRTNDEIYLTRKLET